MNARLLFPGNWSKWLTGLIFWSLVGLFFSIQAFYYFSAQLPDYTFTDALKGTLPQWYVWGLLAVFIIRLDRALRLPRANILKRAAVHFPLSILWTLLYVVIEALSDLPVYGKLRPFNLSYVAGEFQWNYPNYWFIIGVYVAYQYYKEYRDRELKASQLQTQLANARLQALKIQLQPHFLFNALNTISAHMEAEPKTARRMIAHLGELLRLSLEGSEKPEITLAEELAFVEHYLEIQRIRFGGRLRAKMRIDPETREALVPSLLLQPLVENAIQHGLTRRPSGGRIEVHAHKQNSRLHLEVCDDGVGLPKDWRLARDAGIGLTNTIERLRQLYDGEQQFEIRNSEAGGVVVKIALPFRRGNPAARKPVQS